MRVLLNILFFITILFLIFILLSSTGLLSPIINKISNQSSIIINQSLDTTVNISNNTIIPVQRINQTALDIYSLNLINKDRQKYGLSNVSLSQEASGQQHASSMLNNSYFSHWDLFDMKPYMRYTLMGGNGSVQENIAYESSESCTVTGCTGNINVTQALKNMEYSMMYNDSICCNNGHRDNILNPYHNEVSIGVAYNSSTVYFVEDFINNYITWDKGSPSYSNIGEVYLTGAIQNGYAINSTIVSYDTPLINLTKTNVPNGPYSFGNEIAGVVSNNNEYYKNISTIIANTYTANNNNFNINFNIKKINRRKWPWRIYNTFIFKQYNYKNKFSWV